MGPYDRGSWVMPAEERGPDLRQTSKVTKPRRLAQGLTTPFVWVRRLQSPLQAKAKAEPAFRSIQERWLGNAAGATADTTSHSPCCACVGAMQWTSGHRISPNIWTSISTRRSAPTPCHSVVPTCRARRPDDVGESRMRGICMSGLTSGDWRRSHASPD